MGDINPTNSSSSNCSPKDIYLPFCQGSFDQRLIFSGSLDKTMRIWSVASGDLLKTMEDHENSVNMLFFLLMKQLF